jgi:hypothetical protein
VCVFVSVCACVRVYIYICIYIYIYIYICTCVTHLIGMDQCLYTYTQYARVETSSTVSNDFLVVIWYKNQLKTVGLVPSILQSAVCMCIFTFSMSLEARPSAMP